MTKAERLFTLLGEVDAELIEEAAAPAPRGTVIHWKRWAAVAACAALILTAPHLMPRMGSSEAPENNAAPEARPPQSAEDKDYGDKADPTDPAGSANENTPTDQETPGFENDPDLGGAGLLLPYDLTSNAIAVYTPTAEGWQTTEVVERAAKRVCTVLTICEPEPAETHWDTLTAWLDLGNGTVVGLYSADYAVVYTCEGDFDPDDTAALTPHIEGIFYDLDATLAAALENPTETWDDSEALPSGDLDEETPILSPASPEGNS